MDGDILGTRKRDNPYSGVSESDTGLNKAPGKGISTVNFGSTPSVPVVRRQTSGNILKRQRSVHLGGGATKPKDFDVEVNGGSEKGGVEGGTKVKRQGVRVDNLSTEELRRYEAWTRSRFDRICIRECILDRAAPNLLRSLEAGQGTGTVKETTTIAVAALAKMFVGDIIEMARTVRSQRGEADGQPIQAADIIEAHARLARVGKAPVPGAAVGGVREDVGGLLSGGSRLTRRNPI